MPKKTMTILWWKVDILRGGQATGCPWTEITISRWRARKNRDPQYRGD